MDNQKIQEHVQTVREALEQLQTAIGFERMGIRNSVEVRSIDWHQQSIEIIEQQQREIAGLKEESAHYWNVMLSATADNERLRQEIENLNSRIESLEKGWDTNG